MDFIQSISFSFWLEEILFQMKSNDEFSFELKLEKKHVLSHSVITNMSCQNKSEFAKLLKYCPESTNKFQWYVRCQMKRFSSKRERDFFLRK